MNNIHPLLKEFFTPRDDYENAIRIHCPTATERNELLELARQTITEEFNSHGIEVISEEDRDYLFFIWRRDHMWAGGEPVAGLGFDAYDYANENTYEFYEFMAIITPFFDGDLEGLGDLM